MNDKTAIIDQRPTTNDQRPTTNDQRPTTNDQRPTTNDPIHVALAVYDPAGTYSQHAGVTITSIFENTKSKVIIHLLHDETLTEDNRKRFIRTAEKYNQTIEFIDITEYAARISDELAAWYKRYTIGALYRIFITDIVPSIEKVIYLDCDVLVNLDINELWNIDIESKALAGAVDLPDTKFNGSLYQQKMRILLNGCKPETYINSGVLLMNLNKIRKKGNLSHICIEWLLRRGRMALAPDQDALNSIFRDDIKIISSKFNQNVFKPDMSDCIMHMLWGKAWVSMRGLYSDRLYWKMFLRSAWGENTSCDEIIDILNDVLKKKVFPTKAKNGLYTYIKKFFTNVIPGRAIRYILMDIYYRLKYKFRH